MAVVSGKQRKSKDARLAPLDLSRSSQDISLVQGYSECLKSMFKPSKGDLYIKTITVLTQEKIKKEMSDSLKQR
jgi:hypothetical protein